MNKLIYASRGGNTKKLALAVAKGAGVAALPVGEAGEISGVDTLFVGASVYAGKIDGSLRGFLGKIKRGDVGSAVVFGSAAGNKSAADEIREILAAQDIPVSDKVFQCRGSFLLANRGRPNEEDLAKAEAFAREIVEKG
ncbi:MAG: flavodoxin [Clostridiales Family XIII bacterium]|jgi:flavodoxin I|nr:flavodoxin [Clostridiales Family XIII bacterium]